MAIFDRWGMQHTGLFTFAQSAKHVGLYQKLGYWPQYLTAIMLRFPDANKTPQANSSNEPVLLSTFKKRDREQTIAACKRLTDKIKRGLDLSDEMRAALAQRTGDVVLTRHAVFSMALRFASSDLDLKAVRRHATSSSVRPEAVPGARDAFRHAARCMRDVCVLARSNSRSRHESGS